MAKKVIASGYENLIVAAAEQFAPVKALLPEGSLAASIAIDCRQAAAGTARVVTEDEGTFEVPSWAGHTRGVYRSWRVDRETGVFEMTPWAQCGPYYWAKEIGDWEEIPQASKADVLAMAAMKLYRTARKVGCFSELQAYTIIRRILEEEEWEGWKVARSKNRREVRQELCRFLHGPEVSAAMASWLSPWALEIHYWLKDGDYASKAWLLRNQNGFVRDHQLWEGIPEKFGNLTWRELKCRVEEDGPDFHLEPTLCEWEDPVIVRWLGAFGDPRRDNTDAESIARFEANPGRQVAAEVFYPSEGPLVLERKLDMVGLMFEGEPLDVFEHDCWSEADEEGNLFPTKNEDTRLPSIRHLSHGRDHHAEVFLPRNPSWKAVVIRTREGLEFATKLAKHMGLPIKKIRPRSWDDYKPVVAEEEEEAPEWVVLASQIEDGWV